MVRTRIAPSPTGENIHIGNLYTALMNWAYAKKHDGAFLIRIEDTDRTRFVEGAESRILETIKTFGLQYNEGPDIGGPYAPYRQSERLPLYHERARELIEKGHAYYCFCNKERLDEVRKQQIAEKKIPKYDRHCLHEIKNAAERIAKGESYVIRLKVPENRTITFQDVIRGDISFESENLDDQVLLKSDGYPTYHLAVVVDDYAMKVSHIIRAEEWISSTPKHILLYEAFGWELPTFAHLPILRNPDRSKLSKRKNPVWANWYLEQGYLPQAILNFLALMGWSHPEQKEIFSLDEFVQTFDIKDVQPVGPAFDPVKLRWMNGEYIRLMTDTQLNDALVTYVGETYPVELIKKTVPLVKERIKTLSEYKDMAAFFLSRPQDYEVDLSAKKELLGKIATMLEGVDNWNAVIIGEKLQALADAEQIKRSEFFMTLRVAITGKKISPPLNESMEILGKEESIARLSKLQ